MFHLCMISLLHFVIVCNAYHDLRTQIYQGITIEDHLCIKLIDLFTTNNIIILKKTGLFLIKKMNAEMQL